MMAIGRLLPSQNAYQLLVFFPKFFMLFIKEVIERV
jgi:hypothetical protein